MGKSTLLLLVLSIAITGSLAQAKKPVSEVQSLITAAQTGDSAKVKSLLNDKNINAQDENGMTPLMSAAIGGNMDLVKLLLSRKASLELKNSAGDTALAVALTNDQFEIAKLLIKSGAKVNITVAGDEGDTLFMRAASNDLQTTKAILGKDKSVLNKTNKLGETALMQSARAGQIEVVKYLLASGADSKAKSKEGQTALDIAKLSQNDDVIRLFKKK